MSDQELGGFQKPAVVKQNIERVEKTRAEVNVTHVNNKFIEVECTYPKGYDYKSKRAFSPRWAQIDNIYLKKNGILQTLRDRSRYRFSVLYTIRHVYFEYQEGEGEAYECLKERADTTAEETRKKLGIRQDEGALANQGEPATTRIESRE